MTPKHYALALLEQLDAGMRPADALSGLDATLAHRGHEKLKQRVLAIVHRTLTARSSDDGVILTLAVAGDEKRHKAAIKAISAELGVSTPTRTVVDNTLIGGFTITTADKRADHSYKRTLYNLYRNIINASHT